MRMVSGRWYALVWLDVQAALNDDPENATLSARRTCGVFIGWREQYGITYAVLSVDEVVGEEADPQAGWHAIQRESILACQEVPVPPLPPEAPEP